MTSQLSGELATAIRTLGYADSDGLFMTAGGAGTTGPMDLTSRDYLWRDLDYRVNLEAAFFHDGVPLVGFTDAPPGDGLLALRKRLWNYGRVPLLIAATDDGFAAYNGVHNPKLGDEGLLARVSYSRQSIARELTTAFSRRNVETGQFSAQFRSKYERPAGVYRGLLTNLRYLRRTLGARKDEFRTALDTLIGACITASYLADRDVLDRTRLTELARVSSLEEALNRGRPRTRMLFSKLAERFNGDVFGSVVPALDLLDDDACRKVAELLRGDDLPTGQGALWPYDFKVIPSDLVTGVYEQLLEDRQRRDAAFYTPRAIVDLILDEVVPWHAEDVPALIDLACGSGAFLTEAFRRIAFKARWRRGGQLGYQELRDLLTGRIFGVDSNPDAVRVAAFGTYLALLEEVHPPTIWMEAKLPPLIGTNIVVSDAFGDHPLRHRQFDVVVGNPPWKETLTKAAREFVSACGAPIANRQIAQAFVWLADDMLRPGGTLGLVLPAKSVLHNRADVAQEFRAELFERLDARAVVDLSPIRRTLFAGAIGPPALLIADKPAAAGRPAAHRDDRADLIHVTVRPRSFSTVSGALVIAPEDLVTVRRSQARSRSDIWKTLVWGTLRDLDFLDRVRAKYLTLGEVLARRGWRPGQGYKEAPRQTQQDASFLIGKPVVDIDSIGPLKRPDFLPGSFSRPTLHRPRDAGQYRAPQVIIRRTLPHRRLASAFLDQDAGYPSELLGIAGPPEDAEFLRLVAAVIASSYGNYWQFMTSASWGVERDAVEMNELLAMPVPCTALDEIDPVLRGRVRDLIASRPGYSPGLPGELDEAIFDLFNFSAADRLRIKEGITGKLGWFYAGHDQPAAADSDIGRYAETLRGSLSRSMADVSVSTGFEHEGNYVTVWVSFADERALDTSADSRPARRVVDTDAILRAGGAASAETTGLVSLPAAFLIDEDAVYLVKTEDRDRWSYDAALDDAARIVATLAFGA